MDEFLTLRENVHGFTVTQIYMPDFGETKAKEHFSKVVEKVNILFEESTMSEVHLSYRLSRECIECKSVMVNRVDRVRTFGSMLSIQSISSPYLHCQKCGYQKEYPGPEEMNKWREIAKERITKAKDYFTKIKEAE